MSVALQLLRSRARVAAVVLCACAAFSLVYPIDAQDGSRLGLTDAVASYGSLHIDRWAADTGDKARFGGHWYSDKAPAMSFLAMPMYGALRAADAVRPSAGPWTRAWTLWLLRLSAGGVAFVALLLLLAGAADELEPGAGPLTAVAVGVGTFALGLATTLFSHLAAGALALLAFRLLWTARRRAEATALTAAAGAAAGLAVLFDYLAGMIVVILVVYLASTTRSARRVAAFVAGGLPWLAALAVYDTLAFGSPLHLSYRYITGFNGREQRLGFFGARLPRLGYVRDIMVGHYGLLLTSPVIVAAACGLVLLWRTRRAEAAAAMAVVVAFCVYSAGYFDPIGGRSPGPRFLGAALPFAALGLAPLARRRPRLVALLTAVSIVGAVADAVRWAWIGDTSTWLFVTMSPVAAGVLVAVPAFGALAVAVQVLLRTTVRPLSRPADAAQ